MGIFSQSKLTIKDIWITALKLYRATFSQTWYLGIVIGSTATASLVINKIYGLKIFNKIIHKEIVAIERLEIAAILSLLGIFFAGIYITSVILCRIHNIGNEQNSSLQDALSLTNKKYMKLAASMFLVLCLTYLGLAMFILPGTFLFILLFMVQPSILFDDREIFESLKSSAMLTWGNWWRTFIVIFPLSLIEAWMSLSVNYAFSSHRWYLISGNLLFAALYYPLFYSSLLVMFSDLKARSGYKLNL